MVNEFISALQSIFSVQLSICLIVTAAHFCSAIVGGIRISHLRAVDVAEVASVTVAVVDADLSCWIAACMPLCYWVTT